MHTDDPHWEEYERRFRALAELADTQRGPRPELASASLYLCLYGDNALPPEEEMAILSRLEQAADQLKGTEISTAYWEDIVLYLPGNTPTHTESLLHSDG